MINHAINPNFNCMVITKNKNENFDTCQKRGGEALVQ